jgi:hypothetical protein
MCSSCSTAISAVSPQQRSQGWPYPVEVQAHAWRTRPGIAVQPFFPAQALMATNRAFRSSRRRWFLQLLREGNSLHHLSAPVPDPVSADGSRLPDPPNGWLRASLLVDMGNGRGAGDGGRHSRDAHDCLGHPVPNTAHAGGRADKLPRVRKTPGVAHRGFPAVVLEARGWHQQDSATSRPRGTNKGRSRKATASSSGITGPL